MRHPGQMVDVMVSPIAWHHDPDFADLGVPPPLPSCQYDMVGPEGIVESHQITKDGKAGATEAVDCKWYIRAPPRSKQCPHVTVCSC
ncbi:Neuropilin and tolloid-like protein 1 [Takifugu flavidus]|uniref:Neuropilin and tolloid-like protein 1 n=1 Tax=Takifugu flavidus TaxID=433684 RepID=A0A5C6NUJ5_9TELE|nr:Neuropilin and tolloid-like protein 1 [Takifugu flavidus]